MRFRPLWIVIALIAVYGPCALAARGGDAAPSQPTTGPVVTATRQNAFTIPFRIEAVQNPAQQPVEVQLHMSANAGRTWEMSSKVKPERGSFVFRAPHDGEYWFAIRTVDAQGAARPEALDPQLKVVVDTVAPRLEVNASRGPAGEIVANWQAVDPNLKLGTFKLEYQTSAGGAWERVAVESPPTAMRYTHSGQTTWWPKTSADSITVRAEITDSAGNPASSQAVVALSDAGGTATAKRNPPNTSPPADETSNATRWPPERSAEPLESSDPRTANPRTIDPPSGDATWRGSRPGPPKRNYPNARTVSQPGGKRGSGAFDSNLLPPGEQARMVASRSFELEYEIDSVGPSGIGKVELWGTTDGGHTWSLHGVDNDNRSPMPVRVDGEGLYGFRITVQSGSGLGGRQPAEGDLPEIWIGVDLTKPTGRITGAETTPDGSELIISWEASDDLLDPRPIGLDYGAVPGGPWTPVASGLENAGSFRWRLDNRVPERIYLRLDVRDEAGNVGVFETPDPVSLDRSRPEGHIRGVRAVP